jgi:hypothetical protein
MALKWARLAHAEAFPHEFVNAYYKDFAATLSATRIRKLFMPD